MQSLTLFAFAKAGENRWFALMPGGTSGGDARLRLKPRSMLQTTIAVGASDTACPSCHKSKQKHGRATSFAPTAATSDSFLLICCLLRVNRVFRGRESGLRISSTHAPLHPRYPHGDSLPREGGVRFIAGGAFVFCLLFWISVFVG